MIELYLTLTIVLLSLNIDLVFHAMEAPGTTGTTVNSATGTSGTTITLILTNVGKSGTTSTTEHDWYHLSSSLITRCHLSIEV